VALSKAKKQEIIDEVSSLLEQSKMTVVASYPGTNVTSMQQLRKQAQDNGTVVRVIKNRLIIKALQANQQLQGIEVSALKGQLLYAFNDQDEVAAAQILAQFAKQQPSIQFVGGIEPSGRFVSAADITVLANLPTQEALRGQLVGTLSAPLTSFVSVISGNLRGLVVALNARAELIQ